MRGVNRGTQSHNRKQITAFAFTCFLGGRLSVCVVFVVLFFLYIVHTYSTEQSLLGRSYSRMSSIYGSNPFKTRSCKQVDPMYYCLDQYIHCVVALHSECFEKRVEIIPNQVNVIKIFNSVPEIYI